MLLLPLPMPEANYSIAFLEVLFYFKIIFVYLKDVFQTGESAHKINLLFTGSLSKQPATTLAGNFTRTRVAETQTRLSDRRYWHPGQVLPAMTAP